MANNGIRSNGNVSQQATAKKNEKKKEKEKTKRSWPVWVVVLLIFIVLLLILSTIILGWLLYERTTTDQHSVSMSVGDPDGQLEIFRIEYSNEDGQITVKGAKDHKVLAPGTTVDYDIRLRNNDEVVVDFLMTPLVEFLTEDEVPIEFKMIDNYGNYILGSDNTWASVDSINKLQHNGSVRPGEVYTYHLSWQWVFEKDEGQNAYDTYLGNEEGKVLPGVKMSIRTHSTEGSLSIDSGTDNENIAGRGCCCRCPLYFHVVFLFLLVIIFFVVWTWRMHRKLFKNKKKKKDGKNDEEEQDAEKDCQEDDQQGTALDE